MPFVPAHFLTLDRQDGSSRLGAETSHTFDTPQADLRYDAHAQYLDADTGVGGYVVVPGAFRSTTAQSASYLGNVEAGAMFLLAENEERRFAVHVGVVAPTHWSVRENRDAKLTSFSARANDIPQDLPGYGVRGGLTWQGREGRTFSQLDLGVDLPIDDGDWKALRVDAGGGVEIGDAALTIELNNRFGSKTTVDAGAVGIRFHAGPVEPYAAVVVGLVQTTSAKLYEAVTVGIDAPL